MWLLLNLNTNSAAAVPLTIVLALLTGALSGTVGPNMRAMILNVNLPETRGTALALQTMLDDLGKGAQMDALHSCVCQGLCTDLASVPTCRPGPRVRGVFHPAAGARSSIQPQHGWLDSLWTAVAWEQRDPGQRRSCHATAACSCAC